MKIAVSVMTFLIFAFLIASPVGSSYFDDSVMDPDTTVKPYSISDTNNHEASSALLLLLTIGLIGLVAVRKDSFKI